MNERTVATERTRPRAAAQIAVALALLIGGCRTAREVPATPSSSAPAPALRSMVRTELYCGLSRPDGGRVSDAEWSQFLDEVVTPRFPDGFSVLDGYGQYRERSGAIDRERSKVIVILHEPSPRAEVLIEEVRRDYVARFEQESVMRTDDAVMAGF
jgi:hypothetical protein